jgi:hypothetical protein
MFREYIILKRNINKHKSTFCYTESKKARIGLVDGEVLCFSNSESLIDTNAAREFSINPGQEEIVDTKKLREYFKKPLKVRQTRKTLGRRDSGKDLDRRVGYTEVIVRVLDIYFKL